MGDIVRLRTHSNVQKMQKNNSNPLFENSVIFNKTMTPEDKAGRIRDFFIQNENDLFFPVVHLANSLGIAVYVDDLGRIKDFQDLKGYLAIKPKAPSVIVVSEDEPYEHQRWTVAHELWHYFTHKDDRFKDMKFYAEHSLNQDITSESFTEETDEEEKEANRFAAELLMPEKEFKRRYRELILKGSPLYVKKELSESFGVSQTAVRKRLMDLNLAT